LQEKATNTEAIVDNLKRVMEASKWAVLLLLLLLSMWIGSRRYTYTKRFCTGWSYS